MPPILPNSEDLSSDHQPDRPIGAVPDADPPAMAGAAPAVDPAVSPTEPSPPIGDSNPMATVADQPAVAPRRRPSFHELETQLGGQSTSWPDADVEWEAHATRVPNEQEEMPAAPTAAPAPYSPPPTAGFPFAAGSTQANAGRNGRNGRNGQPAATGSIVATEPQLTTQEIDLMFACMLRYPQVFGAALQQLQPQYFDVGEEPHGMLWAAAVDLSMNDGQCTYPALFAELGRRLADAGADTISSPESNVLGDGGLLARVMAYPADQLVEETGRRLLARFLVERGIYQTLQHQFHQAGLSEALPVNVPDIIRMAGERVIEIQEATTGQPRLRFLTDAEFAVGNYAVEWHVPGLLARRQPCVIGGAAKSLKTSFALDLAISIAGNLPASFLGYSRFRANQGRVLFFSAESGEGALQDARRRMTASKGLNSASERMKWCFDPPKLSDAADLAIIRREFDVQDYEVVFFDPLYLMLLDGKTDISAANLYQMGPLFLRISRLCLDAGVTPVFVHHFNRVASTTTGPPTLDNLTFAGVAEFARQWILISRRQPFEAETGHSELWLASGGSAGHSGLWVVDVTEGRWDDPDGRRWRVTVVPADEHRAAAERAQEVARENAEEQLMIQVLDYLMHHPAGEVVSVLRAAVGASLARVEAATSRLLLAGRIEAAMVPRHNGQSYEGFRLIPMSGGHLQPRVEP